MEINLATLEAMIVLLYKIDEFEACDALLQAYKRILEEQAKMEVLH